MGGNGGYFTHHACFVLRRTGGGGADPPRPARRSIYHQSGTNFANRRHVFGFKDRVLTIDIVGHLVGLDC